MSQQTSMQEMGEKNVYDSILVFNALDLKGFILSYCPGTGPLPSCDIFGIKSKKDYPNLEFIRSEIRQGDLGGDIV